MTGMKVSRTFRAKAMLFSLILTIIITCSLSSTLYAQGDGLNHPPRWDSLLDSLYLQEGNMFSYTFTRPVDNDGDEIAVVLHNLPEGAAFDPSGLTITWTPGLESHREYRIFLLAEDGEGGRARKEVVLFVRQTNRAPELSLPGESIEESAGEPIEFPVLSSDVDGDPIEVTVQGLPESAVFLSPVFRWPNPIAGEYPLVFTVTDADGLSADAQITLLIDRINNPPKFKSFPDAQLTVGEPYELTLEATDPDEGESLTYRLIVRGDKSVIYRGAQFNDGVFTWTPQESDAGPNILAFEVSDSHGATDRIERIFMVVGRNIKAPPRLAGPENTVFSEGEEIRFSLGEGTSNPEGVLYWSANLPEGAGLDSKTGQFSWTPRLDQGGVHKILLGVSDKRFQCVNNFKFTVEEQDQPPVLEPVGDLDVFERDLLRFHLQATDSGGDPLSFSAEGLPENAVLYSGGLFSFRPRFGQEGLYPVTFYVSDPAGNVDSETVNIIVEELNRLPEIVVENQQVDPGQYLQFVVDAYDPDGDTLLLSMSGLPEGASFDESTGQFDWMPDISQVGSYMVLVMAQDKKHDALDSVYMTITVGDANLPPEIDPVAHQVVSEGQRLVVEIDVSDPDSADEITLEAQGLPPGADFSIVAGSSNPLVARIDFTAGYQEFGFYTVKITASDNHPVHPLSMTSLFLIEVTEKDFPPVFTGLLDGTDNLDFTVKENESLELELSAEDPGGDQVVVSSIGLPRNARIEGRNGTRYLVFKPAYDQEGEYEFTITASDGASTISRTMAVTVENINRAPVVFDIDDQAVMESEVIAFEVGASDPDGDSSVVYTAGRVPFLTAGENPPAYIRDGRVFVFDTALLPVDQQIESANFLFWAVDESGKVSDTISVEIAVVRSDTTETLTLANGQLQEFNPAGFGLHAQLSNETGQSLEWQFAYTEKSGFMSSAGLSAQLAEISAEKKINTGVFAWLAGDLQSKFYGIRRGWGLDLSNQQQVQGANFTVSLNYFDEDLPFEVPNFSEDKMAVFAFNAVDGIWVKVEGAVLDTVSNQASFTITDYTLVDYTIGAVLDVVEPVISGLKVLAGDQALVTSGADTTYYLDAPFELSVNITDDEFLGNSSAAVYYSLNGGAFERVDLSRLPGNLFSAELPALASGDVVRYYICASDGMNEVTFPKGAPDSSYSLSALEWNSVGGDVDGNGKVEIFDLLELLRVLSGEASPSPGGDVNSDNSIDIFDLLELLGLLVG